MAPQLSHLIVYVADMEAAVAFYRDIDGLEPRQVSPEWSEVATGETTLAPRPMRPPSPANSAHKASTSPSRRDSKGTASSESCAIAMAQPGA